MNVLGVRKFINSCNKKLQVMIKLINSLINALFIDTINCVNKNWKVFFLFCCSCSKQLCVVGFICNTASFLVYHTKLERPTIRQIRTRCYVMKYTTYPILQFYIDSDVSINKQEKF